MANFDDIEIRYDIYRRREDHDAAVAILAEAFGLNEKEVDSLIRDNQATHQVYYSITQIQWWAVDDAEHPSIVRQSIEAVRMAYWAINSCEVDAWYAYMEALEYTPVEGLVQFLDWGIVEPVFNEMDRDEEFIALDESWVKKDVARRSRH